MRLTGLAGPPRDRSRDVERDGHSVFAYLAVLAVVGLLVAVVAVVVSTLGSGEPKAQATDPERAAKLRKLPVYWTVKRGDTYVRIAQKTGLTVGELEDFNPRVDPSTIQPGQRLKLRKKVPKPRPKPRGPKYYTLKPGDSYGSIAADTGKNITRLMRLNPKLKAKDLQPGDRVRLR